MNRDELRDYLPHREPMLLIDEAEVGDDGAVYASYQIKEDDFFLQGHFPGNPIVPGVILCEVMAQSCALLVKDAIVGKTTLYSGIDDVRFKLPVRPGDVCKIVSRLNRQRGNYYLCDSSLYVENRMCCKGSLSFVLV